MERRSFLKTSGLVATIGMTSLAGCSSGSNSNDGSDEDADSGNQPATPPADDNSNTVLMITEGSEYYFDPIGLFVESGETVLFENESGSHSATAYKEGNGQATVTRIPDGAEEWDSGVLSEQGATFKHTFETPGTYDYYCTPHKGLGMVGRIVVGEPSGPADGNMPPDGTVPESQTIVDQKTVSFNEFSR